MASAVKIVDGDFTTIKIIGTTASTSATTGALTVAGGVGIAGTLTATTLSAGTLTATTLSGSLAAGGLSGATATSYVGIIFDANTETIGAGTGGAISVTTYYSDISTDAGGDGFTLAAGTMTGQLKNIRLTTDGGGDAVITGTFAGGTTLTMNDAGDEVLLMWNGSAWRIVKNVGALLT